MCRTHLQHHDVMKHFGILPVARLGLKSVQNDEQKTTTPNLEHNIRSLEQQDKCSDVCTLTDKTSLRQPVRGSLQNCVKQYHKTVQLAIGVGSRSRQRRLRVQGQPERSCGNLRVKNLHNIVIYVVEGDNTTFYRPSAMSVLHSSRRSYEQSVRSAPKYSE